MIPEFPPPARPDAPLEVGVVGAGRIATLRHLPVLSRVEDATLAFVADVDERRARNAGRGHGCRAVYVADGPEDLPDCDVALLATPVGTRQPYVEAFARRSVPVLSEKPFATDLKTHRRLLDAHPAIACNYLRWNFGNYRQARRLLSAAPFGDLERIRVREPGKVGAIGLPADHYQTDPQGPGSGILVERGCHTLSQLVGLFPDEELAVREATISRTEGVVVDVDATLAVPSSDVAVDLRLTAVEDLSPVARLSFEHGAVTIDPTTATSCSLSAAVEGGERRFPFETPDEWASHMDEAIYLRWQQFLAAARTPDAIDAAAETGLEVSRLLGAIADAAGEPTASGTMGGVET